MEVTGPVHIKVKKRKPCPYDVFTYLLLVTIMFRICFQQPSKDEQMLLTSIIIISVLVTVYFHAVA